MRVSDQVIHLCWHIWLLISGDLPLRCRRAPLPNFCNTKATKQAVHPCLPSIQMSSSLCDRLRLAGGRSAECTRVLCSRESTHAAGKTGGYCCDAVCGELELQAGRLDRPVYWST